MRVLIAALALASCYRPRVAPCQYHCAADTACPDGLTCNMQLGMCVTAADPTCPLGVDGGGSGMDGGPNSDATVTTDVMPTSCTLFGSAIAMAAPSGAAPHSIATGDLDGDGYVDAVVASVLPEIGIDFGVPGQSVAYQPDNIGSGTPVYQAVPFSLGIGNRGVAYSFTAGGVSYLVEQFFDGRVPGLLLTAQGTGTATVPIALAVADYDVGTPSLTEVVTTAMASTVFTYGNTSAAQGSDELSYHYNSSALPPAVTAVIGKVDSDAKTDVVLVYQAAAQVLYDPYTDGGDPGGSDVTSLPLPFTGTAVAAALVTLGAADASPDLVIATGDGLLVGYSQASAMYPFGSAFALVPHAMTPGGIATGDFDRDGEQDVIVTDGSSNLVVFEGLPDGSFKEPLTISLTAVGIAPSGAIAAGDFTGDDVPDLVVANGDGLVMLPDICGSGS